MAVPPSGEGIIHGGVTMALPCLGISYTRTRRDLAGKTQGGMSLVVKTQGGMSLVVKNGLFAHTQMKTSSSKENVSLTRQPDHPSPSVSCPSLPFGFSFSLAGLLPWTLWNVAFRCGLSILSLVPGIATRSGEGGEGSNSLAAFNRKREDLFL
ncbi:hypothetical protein BDP81DRAFT_420278 [Colletotrichum phormii]|uniref:Uncharacterized protein n=1 Tax=Colletotrichum phormii TaxID=359342 RepID=A0AAI9ZZ60_9PEZI|nr:uncharacterized protein BDP81DRAFT_420278 [Colletotrichum phormii]KAK1640551.1 hypothetical protein BDP81DRAFT_420278 [Colletotrichum phormii]